MVLLWICEFACTCIHAYADAASDGVGWASDRIGWTLADKALGGTGRRIASDRYVVFHKGFIGWRRMAVG